MPVTAEEITRFLDDELAIDVDGIDTQSLLFSTGIIDSFSLVSLITFLEKKCGFRMSPGDVNLDNLDSIERILTYSTRMANDDA